MIALCLVAALSFGVSAQGLPAVPSDSLAWRMNMAGMESIKAGRSRDTSIGIALVGGIFTCIAADRSARVYDQRGAFVLGVGTALGYAIFQYKGTRHDRKEGKYLRGHL